MEEARGLTTLDQLRDYYRERDSGGQATLLRQCQLARLRG
jgi:hypothetical protein